MLFSKLIMTIPPFKTINTDEKLKNKMRSDTKNDTKMKLTMIERKNEIIEYNISPYDKGGVGALDRSWIFDTLKPRSREMDVASSESDHDSSRSSGRTGRTGETRGSILKDRNFKRTY